VSNSSSPAYSEVLDEKIVHLARLALSGRRQDVELFIRRLARNSSLLSTEAIHQLLQLLQDSPTLQSPFRNNSMAAIPVDVDSRLQLLRHENPVTLDVEPIWSDEIREKFSQLIAERKAKARLLENGLYPTRSALFIGSPGVGKTLAARWLAEQLKMPLLILDLSAVISSFLGRTGNNVRNVLDYAKQTESVLLLDEFDAIAKRRDDSVEVGELKRLVAVLLQEIDDWPPSGLLVAATNHPDLLDPAVWRRFELVLEFPMPSGDQISAAIPKFLGAEISSHWQDILKLLLAKASFSEIQRELHALRRSAVIKGGSAEELMPEIVRDRIESLDRNARIVIAKTLAGMGYPQRKISEWTGVSRDTIRKRS